MIDTFFVFMLAYSVEKGIVSQVFSFVNIYEFCLHLMFKMCSMSYMLHLYKLYCYLLLYCYSMLRLYLL